MQKLYIYILLVLVLISCKNTADKNHIVAKVNGDTICVDELNVLIQQELFDELNRIHEIKKEALRQLVNLKIFTLEAKKVGLSKDLYLTKYVDDKILRLGVDSLCEYYNISHRSHNFHAKQLYYVSDETFEGKMLKKRDLKLCIISELIDSLRNVYHVETYLYPPKNPKFKLNDVLGYYRGDTLSKVSILIISDFDCENCIVSHQLYNSIYEEYKDRVKFGYINFSATPTLAQIACDAANEQQQFWAYHDSLYSHKGLIDSSAVYKIAKQLNLNLDKFDKDVRSEERKNTIEKTIEQLVLMGIYATPTILVNGRLILNSNSKKEITTLIDEELQK